LGRFLRHSVVAQYAQTEANETKTRNNNKNIYRLALHIRRRL